MSNFKTNRCHQAIANNPLKETVEKDLILVDVNIVLTDLHFKFNLQ